MQTGTVRGVGVFNITVEGDLHLHLVDADKLEAKLEKIGVTILHKLGNIMSAQSEAADILRGVVAQQAQTAGILTDVAVEVAKVGTEVEGLQTSIGALQQQIVDLETAAAEGNVGLELMNQIQAVKVGAQTVADGAAVVATSVKSVDDKVPDAPSAVDPGVVDTATGTTPAGAVEVGGPSGASSSDGSPQV